MKIRDILGNLEGVTTHVAAGEDVEITRGFVGDLLSFVMGSAPEKALWVTIQNHVNVAAVALLKEVPLVLLASGRVPSLELKDQCHKEGIALASVNMDSFEVCGRLFAMGVRN
ncbi:MAG: DRTGG domain protein [Synergistetes bacterium ADurb.Bin155]|jgi:hypothetical protein|nr:serine kinase [Synergistales bacterium]MBP8995494.1 serine kinase [Synergistales bacterium]NMD17346.1 serine kinase [Synergistaceae bacterium]OQB46981.1 MAG: DRTGG domain protein [Synergistetes bacterium ADurb.Bin155]